MPNPSAQPSALLYAAAAGDASQTRRLLNKTSAAPSIPAAFFLALQNGHADVITLLLANAASLANATLGNGCTPLYTAAAKGLARVARALIDGKAHIDTASASGATPLFIACQRGQSATADVLLAAGADATLADKTGATPLYVAAQNGQRTAVETILLRRPDAATSGLEQPKATGAAPLYVAAQKGELVIAACLLRAKAQVDQLTKNGASPLLVASLQGHSTVVSLLLSASAPRAWA